MKEATKELYVFKIGSQYREGRSQEELRNGVISMLEIAPIFFKISKIEEGKFKREFEDQTFTFETQEEARQFAIKILRTSVIFFCELKRVAID